jgi:L-ribulose-5-phosphate 3-epimerase
MCRADRRTEADPADGAEREVPRRSFLSGSALTFALGALGFGALGLGATGAQTAQAAAQPPGTPDGHDVARAKPFKISLTQWSLHRELQASRLDPLDFAKAANGFGIDAIEYVSQFYQGKATDKGFLGELKRRAAGEGVASLLIRVEGEGNLGAREVKGRQRAVDTYKKWVDAAAFLGCHSIRVNATSQGSEDEQANWVSDGLRRLSDFSGPRGIEVLVENQGGLSSKGSWLSEVLSAVHQPRCGSLPSFGSSEAEAGAEQDRYKGLRELMPFARGVCAKAFDFDARGEETKINYAQMLKIVTDAGYHGYVGISYEGDRLSEQAGIERTKAILERVRDQLSARAHR